MKASIQVSKFAQPGKCRRDKHLPGLNCNLRSGYRQFGIDNPLKPTMNTKVSSLLLSALLFTACTPMEGRGGLDSSSPRRGEMEGGSGSGSAMVVDNLQAQLQKTAEALRLTPTQATLWDAYQERVGALMADQMKLQPYRAIRLNAMQQIDQKVETVRNRLTAMEEIQETASKLYSALNESQKKTADQMLPGTVPALYSGLRNAGDGGGERNNSRRNGPDGGMRGPGGGMGGFGRM